MANITMTNNELFYNRTPASSITITEKKNGSFKISIFPIKGRARRLKNVRELNYNGPAFTVHSVDRRTKLIFRSVKNREGHYINFYKTAPVVRKFK